MTKSELLSELRQKQLKKLTGPPEHWLTTFSTGFWGLPESQRDGWNRLKGGDLCVFHSTSIRFLPTKPKVPTGVIAVGVVERKDVKTSLEWVREIQSNKNGWPHLIHFSNIWWFGNLSAIRPISIQERLNSSIISDINNLTENCITFPEMTKHSCAIPARGSIARINSLSQRKLASLIEPRLTDLGHVTPATPLLWPLRSKEDILLNLKRQNIDLRDINFDETEEESQKRERKQRVFYLNAELQERASQKHLQTLLILARKIHSRGIEPKESRIDLYAERPGETLIVEVKSIHGQNFRRQTRNAVGQLLEYEHFDVKPKAKPPNAEIIKAVAYSQRPTDEIVGYLRHIRIEVLWIEDGRLNGDPKSLQRLEGFL